MLKRLRKASLFYIPIILKSWILYKREALYSFLQIHPSSAMAMLTNRCNLRCVMCKQWQEEPNEELNTDDWKRIIKDLKENGIKNIHFTGGEPLLRKDIGGLIAHSSFYGLVVGLTTNGLLLKKETLEDFVNAGLKSIALSIDAVGSAYDTIRGIPNSFEKVKEALFAIKETRMKRRIDAYVNFTLMKDNMKELEAVKRLTDKAGLPLHICLLDKNSSIFNLDENQEKFWLKDDEDFEVLEETLEFVKGEKIKNPRSLLLNFPALEFIKNYFRDPRQENIPCISSQDRIIIDPYGNLLGGCLSMGTFANVKDKSFAILRKEERYKKAKKDMFYKRCGGCSCGYFFNIKCFMPMLIKDLASRIKYLIWT